MTDWLYPLRRKVEAARDTRRSQKLRAEALADPSHRMHYAYVLLDKMWANQLAQYEYETIKTRIGR